MTGPELAPTVEVDAIGRACPMPIIELARAIAGVEVGETVRLTADDPGAKVDVPVWCRMKRHELSSVTRDDDAWTFLVTRAH